MSSHTRGALFWLSTGLVVGSAAATTVARWYYQRRLEAARSHTPRPQGPATRSVNGLITSYQDQVNVITDIVKALWPNINVAVSRMLREMIEPMFRTSLPKPLRSMHFVKFDLGKNPLRLDNILVHADAVQSSDSHPVISMEMDMVWQSGSDCDISLKADYLGSLGIQAIQLQGRLSILLHPTSDNLPCIKAIQYAFVNVPQLDFKFTGLAELADLESVKSVILTTIMDTLLNMGMVLPDRSLYKMDPACEFMEICQRPVAQATTSIPSDSTLMLGVARVTLVSGRGFVEEIRSLGRKNDIPDIYCNISFGNVIHKNIWRTSTVPNNLEPVWNESHDFCLADYDQMLSIHAWDEDAGPLDADDDLGRADVSIGQILLSPGRTATVELMNIAEGGKPTGAFVTVHADFLKFRPNLESLAPIKGDPMTDQLNRRVCGIVEIVVTRAFDLPLPKEEGSSYVKVQYVSSSAPHLEKEYFTGTVSHNPGVDALNPVFDSIFYVPLILEKEKEAHDWTRDTIVFTLLRGDVEATSKSAVIGTYEVSVGRLINSRNLSITERTKLGPAILEHNITIRGVELRSTARIPPVIETESSPAKLDNGPEATHGTVRITILEGSGFMEQRRRFFKADIPDVYCAIKFGSSPTVWRTKTIRNDVTPSWNESKVYPLKNHRQIIHIDVFDEDKGKADDFLGMARIAVGKLLLAGSGSIEVELLVNGAPTGAHIKLKATQVF